MFLKILTEVKDYIKSFTIEPVVVFNILGISVIFGAQIDTDLLIWKLCHIELEYSEDVCANLSLDVNEDAENDVQRKLQAFEVIQQWINSSPTLLYAFFMGALSDKFGRKPLMLIPLFGIMVATCLQIVNYRFIETLPVEFFYAQTIRSFIGGMPMYYLGMYAFGADVSSDRERGSRLARLDGVENLGMLVGVALSPIIFQAIGYYGSFSVSLGFSTAGFLYLLFFVRENSAKKLSEIKWSPGKILKNMYKPVYELFVAITKKRPEGRRTLIIIQIATYCLFWFVLEDYAISYPYFLKVFPGFTGTDYSYFTMYRNIRNAFGLLVLMPIFSTKMQIHEALLNSIILFFEALGFVLSAYAKEIWQFYLAQVLCMMAFCKYALARAIMSKCVDGDEVGKLFSGMSIMGALAPFASNPAYRTLYSDTLETFPSAYMLLTASLMLVAAYSNFYLYTQRHRLKAKSDPVPEEDKTKVDEYVGYSQAVQGLTTSL